MPAARRSRAPKLTETQVHRQLADYFRNPGLGGCAIAFHIRGERMGDGQRLQAWKMGTMSGLPDFAVIDGGRAGFLELKPEGWKKKKLVERTVKLTTHELRQLETHKNLKLAGAWVAIVETFDEALAALEAHCVPLRSESISTERIRRGMQKALAGTKE